MKTILAMDSHSVLFFIELNKDQAMITNVDQALLPASSGQLSSNCRFIIVDLEYNSEEMITIFDKVTGEISEYKINDMSSI